MTKIHIERGDIAGFSGDAVVVPVLQDDEGGGCRVGSARLAMGQGAFSHCIIKKIIPRWGGGFGREFELLARGQIACLDKADQAGILAMAFPVVPQPDSDYPSHSAVDIAMSATALWIDHFGETSSLQNVYFICVDEQVQRRLEVALRNTGLS